MPRAELPRDLKRGHSKGGVPCSEPNEPKSGTHRYDPGWRSDEARGTFMYRRAIDIVQDHQGRGKRAIKTWGEERIPLLRYAARAGNLVAYKERYLRSKGVCKS